MNIWIVNHYAVTPDMPGGTRHFDLARALVRRGHTVTLFASSFHHFLLQEMRTYDGGQVLHETFDGVEIYWIKTRDYSANSPARLMNMHQFSSRFGELYGEVEPKPDVIIGSTVHPMAALAAGKAAKALGVPFVFEIRDLWPQTMIDMGEWKPSSVQAHWFFRIERATIKLADAVIALSPKTDAYLRGRYDFTETTWIPNGIDLEAFDQNRGGTPDHPTLEQLAAFREQGYRIALYSGSIVDSNRLYILPETAELLAEEKVLVALIGSGALREEFEALQRENFVVLPPVPKRMIPLLLDLADTLLLIQGRVLWGSMNKLFDYLAAGKPIIASIRAQHNDPLEQVPGSVSLEQRTPEHLAAAIGEVLQRDEAQCREFAEAARAFVEVNHETRVMTDRLEQVLRSVVPTKS